MTGEEIYRELSFIDQKYIQEAEYEPYPSVRVPRITVIAAAAAVMLFLMGCAVIRLVRLPDVQLVHGATGQKILTFGAISGTPEYSAMQQWQHILSEHPGWQNVTENVIPGYNAYSIDKLEAAEELKHIAELYHLKLLGKGEKYLSAEKLYEALGIASIFQPQSSGYLNIAGCTAYEGGNFHAAFTIPGKNPRRNISGRFVYSPAGYMSNDIFAPKDYQQWREWNYETVNGDNVLLLCSSEYGVIFCAREDALISAVVSVRNEKDQTEKRWLEQVADSLNFSIHPKQ